LVRLFIVVTEFCFRCFAGVQQGSGNSSSSSLTARNKAKKSKKAPTTGNTVDLSAIDDVYDPDTDFSGGPNTQKISPGSDDGETDVDDVDVVTDDEQEEKGDLKWSKTREHDNSKWSSTKKGKPSFYARSTAKSSGEENANSALRFFMMMFPKSLATEIARETNRFARSEQLLQAAKSSKPVVMWPDCDSAEIYVFVGIAIAMALNPRKGGFPQYWQTGNVGGLVGAHFGRYMTLRRYTALRRYLHFTDNSTDVPQDHPNFDKLKKLRCVVDTFNSQSKKFFTLGDTVSVDEAMVKFFGRCFMKQYMANKPTKYGFKLWSLNDPHTGYFYSIDPYAGKRPGEPPRKGLGSAVVLDLAGASNLRKGTAIACDRYFGSIDLLLQLQARGLHCICTLQSNRKGFPKELVPKKGEKKWNRGDSKFATCVEKNISVVVWQDSKPVCIAGTVGQVDGDQCERRVSRSNRGPDDPWKVILNRP
jgi:hypothetical protein